MSLTKLNGNFEAGMRHYSVVPYESIIEELAEMKADAFSRGIVSGSIIKLAQERHAKGDRAILPIEFNILLNEQDVYADRADFTAHVAYQTGVDIGMEEPIRNLNENERVMV